MGIEPTSSAWKAEVLPLNYTRDLGSQELVLGRQGHYSSQPNLLPIRPPFRLTPTPPT